MRQREILSFPMFDHSTITGEKVALKTITASDETANYSSEFKFEDFFQDSLGIIGVVAEFDGNASDTITVTAEFYYGDRLDWGINTQTIFSAVAANTNQFQRIDIQSGWRNYLPFTKVRFKFQKTGTNGQCVITSRLVRL